MEPWKSILKRNLPSECEVALICYNACQLGVNRLLTVYLFRACGPGIYIFFCDCNSAPLSTLDFIFNSTLDKTGLHC
jgi:hypothetical protein